VTSPETRSNDLLEKVEIYEQAGVEHYIIIDSRAWKGREQLYLHSYQLGPTGYRLGNLDDLGRVRIGALDLWLGIEETHISCYNAAGERIRDYVAVEVARAAAEVARVAAENDRRAARVEQAEAEARANRAAAAQAEAEASAQIEYVARADAEARAQAAEARLRDLEAELHRLRGALGDTSSP
jgi:hypothetical protein